MLWYFRRVSYLTKIRTNMYNYFYLRPMNILFINMLNGNFKKKSLQSVTEVHLVLDVSTRVENVHMMNSVTILTVHVWMDVIQDITDPNAQSVKYALDIQSIFIKRTFRKTAYWFIAYTEKKTHIQIRNYSVVFFFSLWNWKIWHWLSAKM